MNTLTIDPRPVNIFDSRQGAQVYDETYRYYRSSTFYVPAGHAAILEVTTHEDYRECVSFYVNRIPAFLYDPKCPTNNKGLDKVYRKCITAPPPRPSNTTERPISAYNDDNKNILRLGYDKYNRVINDFAYITRPGTYYLVADKCISPAIEDCANPTIVDMTVVPLTQTNNIGCNT